MRKSNYNDGYIRVYKEIPQKSDFGAKKNIKTRDTLEFIVKLAYEQCSKRQQDLDFAESCNRTLNLKVKTRYYKNLDNSYKVVIENTLYDIIYIDEDRKNSEARRGIGKSYRALFSRLRKSAGWYMPKV